MFLLDANIIAEVVRNPDGPAAHKFSSDPTVCQTSIIVASEIRYGVARKPESKGAKRALALLGELAVIPFEAPADRHYGELRTRLEQAGTPIGANDMLIAAHALALDCVLVTGNEREFRRVPGLKVENWLR